MPPTRGPPHRSLTFVEHLSTRCTPRSKLHPTEAPPAHLPLPNFITNTDIANPPKPQPYMVSCQTEKFTSTTHILSNYHPFGETPTRLTRNSKVSRYSKIIMRDKIEARKPLFTSPQSLQTSTLSVVEISRHQSEAVWQRGADLGVSTSDIGLGAIVRQKCLIGYGVRAEFMSVWGGPQVSCYPRLSCERSLENLRRSGYHEAILEWYL